MMGKMNKKIVSALLVFMLIASGIIIIFPLSVPTAKALVLHGPNPLTASAEWEDTNDPVGAPATPGGPDYNGDLAFDGIVRWHASVGGHFVQNDFLVQSGYTLTIDAHFFNPYGPPNDDYITLDDGVNITVQSGGELQTTTDGNPFTTFTAFLNAGSGFDGIYVQGGAKARFWDVMVINSQNGVQFESGSEMTSPGIRYGTFQDNANFDVKIESTTGYTNIRDITFISQGTGVHVTDSQVNITDTTFDGHGTGNNCIYLDNTINAKITDSIIDGSSTLGDVIYMTGTSGTIIKDSTLVNGSLGKYLVNATNGASPLIENSTLVAGGGIYSVKAYDGGGGGGGCFPTILNASAWGGGPFDNTTLTVTGDSTISVQWWLHVYCDDGVGSPMAGAIVNIYNNSLTLVASGTTEADGYLYGNKITEFVDTSSVRVNNNPFNVTAASAPFANFTIDTVDQSKTTTVILDVIGGDTTKPSITSPSIISRYADSLTVQWMASESSDAVVWYGLDGTLTTEATGSVGTLLQEVTITGLLPGRSYTYAINSTDAVGNKNSSAEPPISTLYSFSTKFNISLNQGWNMISVVMNQTVTAFDTVLGSIAGEYRAVQWWDPLDSNDHWKHWANGKTFGNDLTDITRNMGLWVYITTPAGNVLQVDGEAPVGIYVNQIPLSQGWNLVGYPSVTQQTTTNALTGLSQWQVVWHFDSNLGSWTGWGTGSQNDLTDMTPGEGYWVYMDGAEVWDIQYV
jgi:hypothetical protein